MGLGLGVVLYRDESGPEWLGRHKDGRIDHLVRIRVRVGSRVGVRVVRVGIRVGIKVGIRVRKKG